MDKLTPERRSANMRRIRSADSIPEMAVRRLVYSLGYRYRLGGCGLPGKPDLVFKGRRKVIFVHGCFWHMHSACREGRLPGTHTNYWIPKLQSNVARDKRVQQQLRGGGWDVLVVWECQTPDTSSLAGTLRAFLGAPRRS